jgi:Fur family transcriptional regulator, ferric uptake regulator
MSQASAAGQDEPIVALRARGERLTPQRLMVLDAIRAAQGHHTAEEIYARVRERYPFVNLATIYRALGWLKDQELVSETDLGGGQIEYEYLGERRHHHTVCLSCGEKGTFDDELVAPLAAALRERYGFAPRIDHLALFGTCRRCQEAALTGGTGHAQ